MPEINPSSFSGAPLGNLLARTVPDLGSSELKKQQVRPRQLSATAPVGEVARRGELLLAQLPANQPAAGQMLSPASLFQLAQDSFEVQKSLAALSGANFYNDRVGDATSGGKLTGSGAVNLAKLFDGKFSTAISGDGGPEFQPGNGGPDQEVKLAKAKLDYQTVTTSGVLQKVRYASNALLLKLTTLKTRLVDLRAIQKKRESLVKNLKALTENPQASQQTRTLLIEAETKLNSTNAKFVEVQRSLNQSLRDLDVLTGGKANMTVEQIPILKPEDTKDKAPMVALSPYVKKTFADGADFRSLAEQNPELQLAKSALKVAEAKLLQVKSAETKLTFSPNFFQGLLGFVFGGGVMGFLRGLGSGAAKVNVKDVRTAILAVQQEINTLKDGIIILTKEATQAITLSAGYLNSQGNGSISSGIVVDEKSVKDAKTNYEHANALANNPNSNLDARIVADTAAIAWLERKDAYHQNAALFYEELNGLVYKTGGYASPNSEMFSVMKENFEYTYQTQPERI